MVFTHSEVFFQYILRVDRSEARYKTVGGHHDQTFHSDIDTLRFILDFRMESTITVK